MLYSFLKAALFSLPPEKAHDLALQVAHLSPTLGKLSGMRDNSRLHLSVGQCHWKFPVALAAGLDKNAQALNFFAHQGFGALEFGTVTLKPQLGNPSPRLFRYPQEASLRNSLGFPNHGLDLILPRLKNLQLPVPLGANIGKNKDSTPDESIQELTLLYQELAPFADYFVINVSSPNTPGLRALQEVSYLADLFQSLREVRSVPTKDLYLKISPDLHSEKIIELTRLSSDLKLTGLIATNTTIISTRGEGGVSGVLLKEKARDVRRIILKQHSGTELIGVGGISDFEDVLDFWYDGGRVLQIYTAYIYQGPCLLKNLQKQILNFLDLAQVKNLSSFFEYSLEDRQKLIHDYRFSKTTQRNLSV